MNDMMDTVKKVSAVQQAASMGCCRSRGGGSKLYTGVRALPPSRGAGTARARSSHKRKITATQLALRVGESEASALANADSHARLFWHPVRPPLTPTLWRNHSLGCCRIPAAGRVREAQEGAFSCSAWVHM